MVGKLLFAFLLCANLLSVLADVCLKKTTVGNETECLYPARAVDQEDLDQFTIICKLSRGQFPFQPRGARDAPRRERSKEGAPHLRMLGSKFEYRYKFEFDVECEKGIEAIAEDMFWVSIEDPFEDIGMNLNLIAREFNANDTKRNNTAIGYAMTTYEKRNDEVEFRPVYRDNLYNLPKEPYKYEYLVVRIPQSIEYNVTVIEEEKEYQTSVPVYDVGYFSYYNPSEYKQIIEVFLDTKHTVKYFFSGNEIERSNANGYTVVDKKFPNRTLIGDIDNDVNTKVPYNISIPAYTSLTARIVGRLVEVESTIMANSKVTYSEDGDTKLLVYRHGKKYELFLTDFHLEDAQMHHTSEVLVLNYTTIYVALICMGVVILAAVLVFTIRAVIKRFKGKTDSTRSEVPYQTLQANS